MEITDSDNAFSQLYAKALGAVNAGADPDAVSAKLKSIAISKGLIGENTIVNVQPDAAPVSRQTKQDYNGLVVPDVIRAASQQPNSPAPFANVEGGSKADTFNNVEGGAVVNGHPEIDNAFLRDTSNIADNLIDRGLIGSIQKGIGGAEIMAGGVLKHSPVVPDSVTDKLMELGTEANRSGTQKLAAATGASGVVGGLLGGATGSFLFNPVADAAQKLDEGKSLTDAELTNFKGSAINAAMVGAGAFGPQTAGVLFYLGRAGSQAAAGIGITAADKALEGESLNSTDIATNVGMSLFGGLGRHESVAKSKPEADVPSFDSIKTGEPAVDSGIDFAKSLMDKTTVDVSKPFTQNFEPGWRYKAPEQPKINVTIGKTPLDATTEATTAMQAAIARRAERARQNMADAVGPYENAQDISKAVIDDTQPPLQPNAPAPNDALATPEMAQFKDKLAAEQSVKDVQQAPEAAAMPAQPESVSVSTKPVGEELGKPTTTKLPTQKLSVDEQGNTIATPPKGAKVAAPEQSLAEMIAQAKAANKPLSSVLPDMKNSEGSEVFARTHNITSDVMSKLSSDKLTGGDVLDSISHDPHYKNAPEAVALARDMRARAQEFGGADAKISIYDPSNPVHQDIARRAAEHPGSLPLSKSRAMYDTQTHTILINKDVSASTLAHEVNHAITAKALFAGEEGRLNPEAQKAYSNLNNIFDALKEHIQGKADDNAMQAGLKGEDQRVTNSRHTAQTYGLTNLHELDSELRSNAVFRAHLKNIKVGDLPIKRGSFHDAIIQKSKSVYSAIIGGLSKMLGLSKEAETAFDHLYGASEDFQRKVSLSEKRSFRQDGQAALGRNYVPDTSFLGEQVERRTPLSAKAEPAPDKELQKPRSKLRQFYNQLATAGGLDPTATAARRLRSGISAEGSAEAAQSGNRLSAVINDKNRADVGEAMSGNRDAYERLDPKTKDVVQKEWGANFDRSIAAAEAIAENPHATPDQIAHAKTIVKYAGKYQTRVFQANEIKGFMADKLKAAAKGDVEAKQSVDTARKYLENQYLPDTDKLDGRTNAELEDLYKFHTGLNPDEQFKGFKPEERHTALAGAVAERLRTMVDKDKILDGIVEAAAGLGDKKSTTRQYFAGMRTGSDIYSEMKGTPPELRQFWGEVNEPVARNVATIRKQYSYLANLKAQNSLRETGLSNGMFSEARNGVHQEPITGEKMGALQGLFTTPDAKKAIDSVFTMNAAVGDLLDASLADSSQVGLMTNLAAKGSKAITTVAGWTKLASVLGNTGNFANNFLGSHLQLASNGNVNPIMWAKGMKTMGELLLNERKKNMSPNVRDAYQHGLVEYSHIQELQGNANSKRMQQYISAASQEANPIAYLKNKAKAVPELYKELYGAMDLWTKLANWHNEVASQTALNERRGSPLSVDQVKSLTAERINNTNITPSMAPAMLKGLERYGVTRFATYYSEVARTSKNNLFYGAKDLAEGIKTGDAILATNGLKRIAGTLAAALAQNKQFALLAKGVAGAMGLAATQLESDDPRKKYMEKDDFLKSVDPIIISDPNSPESGEYVYDLSRPDPYGPITTPIRDAAHAISLLSQGDNKGAADKASEAIANIKDLYWSSNSMWKAVKNVIQAKAPSSRNTAPDFYKDSMEKLTAIPGMTVENAHRIMDAMAPIEPKSLVAYLQSKNVESPALADVVKSGIGATPFNMAKDISNYLGGTATSDIKSARNDYLDLMKQDFESSPERLEDAFNSTMKKAAAPYEKLRLATQAAKEQGTSRTELIERLKASGVSEGMIPTLMGDRPMKISELAGDLKADLKHDQIDAMKDGAEKREALRRYNSNVRQMNALIRQNRNTDIDEL